MAAAAAWVYPEGDDHAPVDARPIAHGSTTLGAEKQQQRQSRGSRPVRTSSRGFVYDGACAGRAVRAGLSRRPAGGRPLPMEDVAFFTKEMDNTGLRRAADPDGRSGWSRMVRISALALLAVLVCFGPRAWLRHSGYRQAELVETRDDLLRKQRQLLVSHEELTDVRRVAEMAAGQGLVTPGPESVKWQDRSIDPTDNRPALAQTFVEAH